MDTKTQSFYEFSPEEKVDIVHHEHANIPSAMGEDSIEKTNPGKAVWLIACIVSMGGFLFGKSALE